ncbi:MAG: alpha/beta hydrolase [Nitrososphaerota archaeon]|nr:alpha/beta hydrolase [Nitrososphaerota archaeon]MDG6974011.1 alpha/beta hydrolase [Nitrososphaerota archaeon]MDG6987439.1 alpha/beta hydrolase [Nitrososphaerota archaeon]MDG7026627.1 alpha/beta hydrolase [Nitrososphaerota archaeon]
MTASGAYAQVSGGRLYYEAAGADKEPAVVLIHAGFLDRRMWDEQFELLPTEGFRVVRYDLRGSGLSDRPRGPYDDAADLRDLLDHVGVKTAIPVGLSNGGSVAIDFALAYPQRVSGMVLVAPTVDGYEYGSEQEEHMARASDKDWGRWEEAIKQGRVDEAIDIHLSIMGQSLGAARQKVASMAKDNYRVFTEPFSELRAPRSQPAFKMLGEIRAPTLLVWGDNDFPGQITCAERIHQKIPRSSRILIRGADHLVNISQPGAFNEALLSFLGAHA